MTSIVAITINAIATTISAIKTRSYPVGTNGFISLPAVSRYLTSPITNENMSPLSC